MTFLITYGQPIAFLEQDPMEAIDFFRGRIDPRFAKLEIVKDPIKALEQQIPMWIFQDLGRKTAISYSRPEPDMIFLLLKDAQRKFGESPFGLMISENDNESTKVLIAYSQQQHRMTRAFSQVWMGKKTIENADGIDFPIMAKELSTESIIEYATDRGFDVELSYEVPQKADFYRVVKRQLTMEEWAEYYDSQNAQTK